MKRMQKGLSLLLTLAMLLGMGAFSLHASALDLQGSGTPEDPYQIGNYADLKAFAAAVNGGETALCAEITENITAKNSLDDLDFATDWIPIGDNSNAYVGTFDGQGHTVTGLSTPSDNDGSYVGLFGLIGGSGIVKNLDLIDASIVGSLFVGGIAGNSLGTIQNCSSAVTVTGESYVGGIAGAGNGQILDSYSACNVTGNEYVGGIAGVLGYDAPMRNCIFAGAVTGESNVGGIVGYNFGGQMQDCRNGGTVSGSGSNIGGLVGASRDGSILNCRNTGDVSGKEIVGGLIGDNWTQLQYSFNTGAVTATEKNAAGIIANNHGTVRCCYNRGDVSGESRIGGVASLNEYAGTIRDCYSACSLTGNDSVKGVLATSMGLIENCYFDAALCNHPATDGQNMDEYNVKGFFTMELTGDIALEHMAGFQENDWSYVEDDYPVLRWQMETPITASAHSLSLGGEIGVNFYAELPVPNEQVVATFIVDGEEQEADFDPGQFIIMAGRKLYKFTCRVAAAQIDTPITGWFRYGERYHYEEFTYSVQEYLTEAQQTMADNAAFMALAGSLATYGYYANELFDFDDNFHQHDLFDDSGFADVTAASLADYEAQITNEAGGVNYAGSSLVLRTETAIKHYFTLPEGRNIDDYAFLLGEGDDAVELTPQVNGSFFFVEIPDIPSAELGDALTVNVIDMSGTNNVGGVVGRNPGTIENGYNTGSVGGVVGGNPATIENGYNTGSVGGSTVNTWTYSAMSYVYKALTKYEANDPSVSDELANAVQALCLYYQAADAYFTLNNA
ncbi:MAG: hypothetical protein IK080_06870 [Clostridia bacterium]|nr:hypothetical protein [Clostridia bacterium]